MRNLVLFSCISISLAACQTTTNMTPDAPMKTANVSTLAAAQFKANGWGNGGWSSDRQARHKCPEEKWFYVDIGQAKSVADLRAFSQRTGITNSRTLKAAEMALNGQSIPSDLRHKAQCLLKGSLKQLP